MDPYKILEVEKTASKKDIKTSYKKLALKYHPDKSNSDNKEFNERKFKEVANAYRILSDDNERKKYDFQQSFNPDDILKRFNINLFNNTKFTNRHIPEKIIKIKLTLDEIYNGCVKNVSFDRKLFCIDCCGNGYTEKINCNTCNGQGKIINITQKGMFFSQSYNDCMKCNKKGYEIIKECMGCGGSGNFEEKVEKKFSFPQGINNGDKLILKNLGDQVEKELFQNVIIVVQEIPHKIFKRKGNNLSIMVDVDFIDTIRYKDFEIIGLNDDVIIFNTDEIIDPRKIYTISGKGINNGDILINFNVKYCKKEELKKIV